MTKRLNVLIKCFVDMPDDGLDTFGDANMMVRKLRDTADQLGFSDIVLKTRVDNVSVPREPRQTSAQTTDDKAKAAVAAALTDKKGK